VFSAEPDSIRFGTRTGVLRATISGMSEMKLGVLVLIGLPIVGSVLLIALTSNTYWSVLALVGIYLLFRRPRRRQQ
jgi:hypothetical protein